MIRASLALALLFAAHLVAADDKKAPPKEPKPTNEIISELVDKPESFKGKTLTLQLAFVSNSITLTERVGDKNVPFTGVDPNNKAKLVLGVELPKGLAVPNARNGEEVVLVFECSEGSISKGNKVISITRPKKVKN